MKFLPRSRELQMQNVLHPFPSPSSPPPHPTHTNGNVNYAALFGFCLALFIFQCLSCRVDKGQRRQHDKLRTRGSWEEITRAVVNVHRWKNKRLFTWEERLHRAQYAAPGWAGERRGDKRLHNLQWDTGTTTMVADGERSVRIIEAAWEHKHACGFQLGRHK